jgi:hypothetical protein
MHSMAVEPIKKTITIQPISWTEHRPMTIKRQFTQKNAIHNLALIITA